MDSKLNNWTIKSIPEILFFQEGPGVRKSQFRKSGIKLLNVGNINSQKLDLNTTSIYISEEEAYGKYKHFLVDPGDLLIACSGIVVSNFHNKIAFATLKDLPLCMNTSTMRFKVIKKEEILIEYFKYFLQTDLFKGQLGKLITGSAQLNFGPSHIKQIKIPLPPLETQKMIAAILDKADELRQNDKKILEKYDQLAQSVFLEMFGDPVRNKKKWNLTSLKDLGHWNSGGTPSRSERKYFEGDIPWLTSGELDQIFTYNSKEKISMEAVKDSAAKILKENSLLLGMYDTAALKSTINKVECSCNQAIAYAEINSELANVVFIYFLIQQGKEYFRRLQRGVRQKNMNLTMIKEIKIILPPKELQDHFAKILMKLEEQKALTNISLQKSEELFQSLLHRAFKGEL